ncbi:MAG: NAD(P)H-hydrate epimerase, partial [Bacteroidia bacterium]
MKILSATQTQEADKFTIAHEPITSVDLMERAAGECTRWILEKQGDAARYIIISGNGNNGGDGLAIARQLKAKHREVDVYIVRVAQNDAADFSENLHRLEKDKIAFSIITGAQEIIFPGEHYVIIDALFGTGLSREPEELAANVIKKMNSTSADKISIDIPSGLFGDDNTGNSYKHVVRAKQTLSFQYPKLAFMFAENSPYVGNLAVLDIHLHPDYLLNAPTSYHYITHDFAKHLYLPRTLFA